ncbi:MAG TPA: YajG family lipoprotein [Nitrospirales bacterium]|jgi:hypothetical protein
MTGRWSLVLGCVLSTLMAACVFTDQTVKLPEGEIVHEQPAKPGKGTLIVPPVADERELTDHIGVKKTAFGIPTGKVYPDRNVPAWLRESVKAELQAAGFNIARKNETGSAPTIELILLKFFVEPVMGWGTETFETDLAVRLRVTSAAGKSTERDYLTRGVAAGREPSEKNYTPSLEQATAELIKRLIPDIIALTGPPVNPATQALP